VVAGCSVNATPKWRRPSRRVRSKRTCTPGSALRRSVSKQQAWQRLSLSRHSISKRGCSPGVAGGRSSTSQRSRRNEVDEVCMICCEDAPPGQAHRLSCRLQHGWYCSSCMLRHAEARLEMGAVEVTCPECNEALAECELKAIIPHSVIDRLQNRSLEQAVSAVADLRACPTPNCTMRVALEEGEPPRFKCPLCRKASCLLCGAQPYHKDLTCEEYAARKALQSKSRKDLQSKSREDAEASFQRWLEETGTKKCPTCSAPVSKENLEKQGSQRVECHKMMCRNCDTRFCFKCLAKLTDSYSCGCSIDQHGFCDPRTGKRLQHLKKGGATRTTAAPAYGKTKK
jgi:hypothetical protein